MILHAGNFVKRLYTGCKIFLIFVDILKPFPVGEGFLFGGGSLLPPYDILLICSPNKLFGEHFYIIKKLQPGRKYFARAMPFFSIFL